MDWDHGLVVCSNGLGEVLVIVINIRPADRVGNCFTLFLLLLFLYKRNNNYTQVTKQHNKHHITITC